MTTIADMLNPAELEDVNDAFGIYEDDPRDYIEDVMGYRDGTSLWYAAWLFGIIVDDDVDSLGCLWQPDGTIASGYYIPDDFDTEVDLITIDNPNRDCVAWDAKPLA